MVFIQDQVQDNILSYDFLSQTAKRACAEGEWTGVSAELRSNTQLLMRLYGWNKFRALREVLGLSPLQMANTLNVCLPTYCALESSEFVPCQWTSVFFAMWATSLVTLSDR